MNQRRSLFSRLCNRETREERDERRLAKVLSTPGFAKRIETEAASKIRDKVGDDITELERGEAALKIARQQMHVERGRISQEGRLLQTEKRQWATSRKQHKDDIAHLEKRLEILGGRPTYTTVNVLGNGHPSSVVNLTNVQDAVKQVLKEDPHAVLVSTNLKLSVRMAPGYYPDEFYTQVAAYATVTGTLTFAHYKAPVATRSNHTLC